MKPRRIRHQGGRGDDAFEVGLQDGAIYSGREAEIVGIDDQSSFSDSALANRSSESVPGRRALSRRRA